MQMIGDLVIRMVLFYSFIAFGFLVTRIQRIKNPLNKWITFILINIMMPLIIIDTLLTAAPSSLYELVGIIGFALLIQILGFSLMFVRLRGKEIEKSEKGSHLLTVTFNNAIFLPIPLTLMFIGEIGIPVIAIYSITQMMLLATLGTFMGSAYSTNSDDTRAVVKKVLTFPPLIAAAIGLILLLLGLSIPPEVDPILEGNTFVTTYLALFAVGLSLGLKSTIKRSRFSFETIAVRQFIVPLVVGILLIVAGLSVVTRNVILLQALMPPGVFTVIYASAMELDAETAATNVTLGTILLLPVVLLMPFLFI
ncbi:MAG: AEC family transporter [Candidatus Thorarchaeota archaeon]|nr:AEC family transporter [Candidatus Thorarchaeota archaeon]MCK5238945.1 AEC family transporter [Candidatus Thorarchaeota archaeon]